MRLYRVLWSVKQGFSDYKMDNGLDWLEKNTECGANLKNLNFPHRKCEKSRDLPSMQRKCVPKLQKIRFR